MNPNNEQRVIDFQALAELRYQIRRFLHSLETILTYSRGTQHPGTRSHEGKGLKNGKESQYIIR